MIDFISTSSRIEPSSARKRKSYYDIRKDLNSSDPGPRYQVWQGHTSDEVHSFFDYSKPKYDENGDPVYLPATITTFYGHELIAPYGTTLTPYADSRKIRLLLITLHRADGDSSREITLPAWQGDNDTIHLMEPLPDEGRDYSVMQRTVFGVPKNSAEERDWKLGNLYYGDTAILDVDISQIITPGKALRV